MNFAPYTLLYQIGILAILAFKGKALWAWIYLATAALYIAYWAIQVSRPARLLQGRWRNTPPVLTAAELAAISRYPVVFDFPHSASSHCGILAQVCVFSGLSVFALGFHGLYIPAALAVAIALAALFLRIRVDPRNSFAAFGEDATETQRREIEAFSSAFAKAWPELQASGPHATDQ